MYTHHRVATYLAGGLGLAALFGVGCSSSTAPDSNTRTKTWTVQLDQDQGGTPGRIWFILNVTLRDDRAQGGCATSTVTTGLGDFTGSPSRIQTSSLDGSATLSWTQGGGACNAFSLILSPRGQGDIVVTGAAQAPGHITDMGFGAVDPSVFIVGSWSTAGTTRGSAYVYPTELGYLPDSHFDLVMQVSETGCDGCQAPSAPAAHLCLYPGPNSTPTCDGRRFGDYLWAHDTTITEYLPRNARQEDDSWYFNLFEVHDGDGPAFQVGCFRPATGADLVTVQIVSGVDFPYVRCQTGWPTTGLLTKIAGDAQTAPAGTRVPVDLRVLLQNATGGPMAGATMSWSVASGGGTLSAASSTTDGGGHASAQWTLGSVVGPQTVTATAGIPGGGTTSVTFQATATAATPAPACGPGGTDHAGGFVTTNLTWDATGNPHRVHGSIELTGATLTVGPGTLVCFDTGAGIIGRAGTRVVAVGTAAAPIRFTAIDSTVPWFDFQLGGDPTDTSYFVHTRIEFSSQGILSHQPVVLDSTVIRQSTYDGLSLVTGAEGSRILRSRIDTTLASSIAVEIGASDVLFSSAVHGSAGEGIDIAASIVLTNITLDHCEVTGSALQGLRTVPSITIHNCNFVGNGGNGVESVLANLVDATDNWWGDAGGPFGPAGDGVGVAVSYTPFLTAPVGLGYAAPALTAAGTPRRAAVH